MWIVRLALRRPYTFIVTSILLLILGPVAILRTPTDIFPNIDIPVVSVLWNYTGLSPEEMSNRIVFQYERVLTTTVNNIEHIESQSLNGIAVVKIFFHSGVDIGNAVAQVTAVSQTLLRQLPQGTTPPLIIQYNASSVPILQLALAGEGLSEQQLGDIGLNFLRTGLVSVPGAAIPYPYGGKQRQVQVDLDTTALQSKGLSPNDVVNAINLQNLILPAGTAKIGTFEYEVDMNGAPATVPELNDLPVKTVGTTTIYIHDVANVRDGFPPQTNIVRVNGQRSALMTILKSGDASTLDIISSVKSLLPSIKATLPPALVINPLSDQSIFVKASIVGVVREAIIAACLTGFMILVFLGSWRSTLIIAVSIPLSILTSLIVLSALGETINIMTLGGLALAVGILVDDATVEIENIERNLAMGKEMRQAILDGAQQIAVPAFVSTLSICIVFVPMFFLSGVAKFLFVPLAEAVSFAMLASYLLSRTLIPTLVMFIMRGHEHKSETPKSFLGRFQRGFERKFEDFRRSYERLLETTLEHRGGFVICFLVFCLLSLGLFMFLGQDFFPQVDAGLLRLHVRARPGLRVEEPARLSDQLEAVLPEEIPGNELQTILDNIGLPNSGIKQSYSSNGTIGSSDVEILIALDPEHHHPTAGLIRRLREVLPQRFPGVEFFFQPADIVTQILNFGLPAPSDVQVVGTDVQSSYDIAQQIANKMRHIPGAADVHVQQLLSLPTLHMDIDRTRVTQVGLTARDVAQSVLVSLSGSFQTSPNFWLNPRNGVTYSLAVQSPQYRMTSMQDLMTIPVNSQQGAQLMSNLVQVTPVARAATVNHYNVQSVIDVYASTQDRDLGAVAAETDKVLKTFDGKLPRGTHIVVRGQVATMRSSFFGLGVGLAGAILLVYLLIVINFQSWLDPFIIIAALPGALAGICWFLLLTRTTLSVPSLTGAVMCMGVATANSILMVSFAREQMDEGIPALQAAVAAGYTRVRPVLMTALAMIIGMVPMALGFGEGGEQNAPLGRAVIGGLLFATVATLFFVPSVFAMFHSRREAKRAQANQAPST